MADQIESAADAETQARAETMGWIPPTRFKGDAANFVDAEQYIERGEQVLPIVKAALAKERETNIQLNTRLAATEAAVAKANKALEDIELKNSVATQKAVEAAKKEVREQLAAASKAGDHEAVASLTEEMVELNKAAPVVEKKAEDKPAAKIEIPAEQQEWQAANAWYGTDRRKTSLMLGIAQELREGGDMRTGKVFLNACKAEMEKTLGETSGDSKVEGGGRNGGGGEDTGGGRKSGYASLPADAKAACDADARNFVGPTKKYKDTASWRAAYAAIYNAN